MIIEKMFDFLGSIVMGILKLFNIPGIPDDVLQSAYNFLDFLFCLIFVSIWLILSKCCLICSSDKSFLCLCK